MDNFFGINKVDHHGVDLDSDNFIFLSQSLWTSPLETTVFCYHVTFGRLKSYHQWLFLSRSDPFNVLLKHHRTFLFSCSPLMIFWSILEHSVCSDLWSESILQSLFMFFQCLPYSQAISFLTISLTFYTFWSVLMPPVTSFFPSWYHMTHIKILFCNIL